MVLNLRNIKNKISGNVQRAGSPETLNISDFMSGDVAVVANVEAILGEMIIPAQQERALGFGRPEFQANQGTIYLDLQTTGGADVEGQLNLYVQDYNGGYTKRVFSERLNILRSGATDITKRVKLPLNPVWGKQNDKIVMKVIADSGVTIGNDESSAEISSSVVYTGRI
jgi:hypothetical protein